MSETDLVRELRARIEELERESADLRRQVEELRDTVAALLAPPPGLTVVTDERDA
jgi:cell division protein FtsB